LRGRTGSTLIFDEVDAGIGGVAADAAAVRLQALGARYQVLCVTHLAQVAARADAHFEISKDVRSGRTHTNVRRLDNADREQELARMIAGASVSTAVLTSAREMLKGGARVVSEQTTKERSARRGA
jgi:DNA repair protein RecN (Recombination protein N)